MAAAAPKGASQEFLDSNQYSKNCILRYERIFGHTYISTGGENTTKEFCLKLNLRPGQRVLDVGCGIGGSAFYMARNYGVFVDAVDLSSNMIQIARERLEKEDPIVKVRVKFGIEDITTAVHEGSYYDVIYSRDTILHISSKSELFRCFFKWLKTDGKVLITDYCKGDKENYAEEFLEYTNSRGYDLRTIKEYTDLIKSVGLTIEEATDKTSDFVETLQKELRIFESTREAFMEDFTEKDYEEIIGGWNSKIKRCTEGDQAWGFFVANKKL